MAICKYFQQGYCRFGQNCRNEHVFASKYSYKAPQTQNTRTGYENFNINTGNTFGNSASALFRNAVQTTSPFQTQGPSVFVQNPTPRPVFDRLGPQQNFGHTNQANSIFANANQSTFGQVQTNVFQSQNQLAAKSLFAEASKNIFGPSQTNLHPAPVSGSVFGIGVNQNFNEQNNPFGGRSMFQISDRPISNPFGVLAEQSNIIDNSVYSEMEDLSQSDIETYESANFKLGFVPELPPARTLCV